MITRAGNQRFAAARSVRRRQPEMRSMPSLSFEAIVTSLPGRVGMVVSAAAAAAIGSAVLYHYNRVVPEEALRWGAAALVAVAAGLTARRTLSGRTRALRLWSALLALLLGLILLGLTTRGAAGAALPRADQAGLNWTWLLQFIFGALLVWLTLNAFPPAVPRGRGSGGRKLPKPARPAAARSAAAGTRRVAHAPPSGSRRRSEKKPAGRSAAAASAAGRTNSRSAPAPGRRSSATPARAERARPNRASDPAERRAAVPARPAPATSRPEARSVRRPPVTVRPRAAAPASPAAAWGSTAAKLRSYLGSRARTLRASLSRWARPGVARRTGRRETAPPPDRDLRRLIWPEARPQTTPPAPPPKSAPPSAASGAARSRTEGVRLVGEEEHRCPFCLEIVEPGDPRGTVECPICHTRHHADCWSVTGICQVPHYHS